MCYFLWNVVACPPASAKCTAHKLECGGAITPWQTLFCENIYIRYVACGVELKSDSFFLKFMNSVIGSCLRKAAYQFAAILLPKRMFNGMVGFGNAYTLAYPAPYTSEDNVRNVCADQRTPQQECEHIRWMQAYPHHHL